MTSPRHAASAVLLIPGLVWGLVQFVAFGLRIEPLPESIGQLAALFFLTLFVGLVHGAVLAGLAAATGRWSPDHRLSRAWDLLLALITGAVYAFLGLSLAKFATARAHLRFDDLWFLVSSARQVGGEGTGTERAWLSFAAVLPLALATGFYIVLRWARRRPRTLPLGGALALAALGAVGIGGVAWSYPAAGIAARTLLADGAVLSRRLARPERERPTHRPDPAFQSRLDGGSAPPSVEHWNVLVVMLESIPWSRLYGPEARPGSTPHLVALAAESIAFDRAYAASTHSDYAQTSILASLYPRKGDGHDYFTDLAYPRALPWDVLAPLGWRSAVVSTQNEQWGNMLAFLRSKALGSLRHAPDFPHAPRRGEGSQTKVFEEAVVDDFLGWVRRSPGQPFVAYLNFQATHYPYSWPSTFGPPFGAAEIDFPTTFLDYPRTGIPTMLNRFHNALAYADANVGRVRAGLESLGAWEHTALLVVSDHGEAFYEHGLPTHGTTLLEEQVRVPMLLRIPGAGPRVVIEPVSVLDALPSLYRAMGLAPHPALQGHDEVLDPEYSAKGRPFPFTLQGMTHEDGILVGDWKWIVNHDRREGALFDLARDPEERYNLALDAVSRRAELEETLSTFLDRQLGYYRARGWESGWGPPRLPQR